MNQDEAVLLNVGSSREEWYMFMVTPLLLQVDVMGCMHFWGLTIDVVSSVLVIVSTGLCVDFSVHIAHAFLTNQVCSLTAHAIIQI